MEMWRCNCVILILIGVSTVQSIPVFTFRDTFYPLTPPSFAFLTTNVELPTAFILCSSSKLARFDGSSALQLLGEDGRPWLAINLWNYSEDVMIWVAWNRAWYPVGYLQNPRLGVWYHMCLEINLQASRIKVAVNGDLVGTILGKNVTNSPN